MDIIDDYEHLDAKIMYILENIATKDTEDCMNEEYSEGCKCENKCTPASNCSCLKGGELNYVANKENSDTRQLQNNYMLKDTVSDFPIYECNKNCACSVVCGNRLVQFGPRKSLRIMQNYNAKGLGLETIKKIDSGSFICEYAGEVINETEARRRQEANEKQELMNYIFCVTENFGSGIVKNYYDPSLFGNIGRYLNHSCQPNCKLMPIRVSNNIPKLCIFASSDIEGNTELCFDYGDGSLGFPLSQTASKKMCLCMSLNCRKFMPFNQE